jgi:starvation-inducible DNA-binding protein
MGGHVASHDGQAHLQQAVVELQAFGTVRHVPVALPFETRLYASQRLNRVLADTQMLRALYKKHHWLVRGPTFYSLHLLLDKHAAEQLDLVDVLAERVQTLGGIAIGDPRHAAEITRIPRAPNGAEAVPGMLARLLHAHECVLVEARDASDRLAEMGDAGSGDLLVSQVIRTNELQAWFVGEHLVDVELVHAAGGIVTHALSTAPD